MCTVIQKLYVRTKTTFLYKLYKNGVYTKTVKKRNFCNEFLYVMSFCNEFIRTYVSDVCYTQEKRV